MPGPKLTPEDVQPFPDSALYDPNVLRTIFLEFENADWEQELAEFYNTDVEVPAKMTVDGKGYPNVGMSFRGASSYFMTPEGYKRSFNVAMDLADGDQRLLGAKTLNLMNSNGDPTMMRGVLYSHVARNYIPTPRANFVRVAINGESWGVYGSVEQFNSDFMKERFDAKKGERWKVPGSPNGKGGLEYIGDQIADYQKIYDIKSKDEPESWQALIQLCKVLNETPADQLEAALAPILDIEDTLKFLALENVFLNEDGYWTRASDYNLGRDKNDRFHIIPHDMNETFKVGGGPGGFGGAGRRGGPGGAGDRSPGPDGNNPPNGERPPSPDGNGGTEPPNEGRRGSRSVKLDPLVAINDADKPLYSKLLAVPALRERYLGYVREIADVWLDWDKISPLTKEWQALIGEHVSADTRKLASTEAFEFGIAGEAEAEGSERPGGEMSLKSFAQQRREFLMN